MDMVAAMQVFVRVAEAGGFTPVARETRTTQPTVSRLVAALEDHLGARLFHRSTRAVSLTDDGKQFYELARHVLEAVAEAENAIGKRRTRAFRAAAAQHPRGLRPAARRAAHATFPGFEP